MKDITYDVTSDDVAVVPEDNIFSSDGERLGERRNAKGSGL